MSAVEEEVFSVDETKEHLRAIIQTQSEIVSAGLDAEALMALVVRRSLELTGASGALVELVDGDALVVRAACGSAAPLLGSRRPADALGATQAVAAGSPRGDAQVPRVDVRSSISVPLRHRDRALGALSVQSSVPHAFTERDERTLTHMGEMISASLNLATTYEAKALRDGVTGLANRALFYDRLNLALTRARRRPSVTVFFIDLDDFKKVNDTLGHAAGDTLLAMVGERLREACRPSDTVARWGGDEFTILADELVGPAEARELAGRITKAFARPFLVGGITVGVGISIGVAQAHDPYSDPQRVIDVADAAMYRAKRRRQGAGTGDATAVR